MTATETSAVTWGQTRLAYTIRRSPRRKKTVAVTVDPAGSVLLVAPEHFPTGPARRCHTAEGAVDRPAPPARRVPRPATRATRVRQRRERSVSRAALSPQGPSGGDRRRQAARRLAACARAPRGAANGSRTSRPRFVVSPSRDRPVARTGGGVANQGRCRDAAHCHRGPAEALGSCDRSGTIRLNWRIIQAPMRLVDYVVVHELVHLRHRGHGRDYWRAVGRVMPDYERRREDLRQRGVGLEW